MKRLALGRLHDFAALSRHDDSALQKVHLEGRLWYLLAPSPVPEPFLYVPCSQRGGRASAVHRPRSAIVLEVITAAAAVALVLYVLFPPNEPMLDSRGVGRTRSLPTLGGLQASLGSHGTRALPKICYRQERAGQSPGFNRPPIREDMISTISPGPSHPAPCGGHFINDDQGS